MTRDAGRRLFDALERALVPAASRFPAFAADAARSLGALRRRLSGRWPSSAEVRLAFPSLSARTASRVASTIAANEARNRLLVASIRQAGLAPLRPLVTTGASFAALRPPQVLGTFHVGAWNALGPALERLGRPVLVLRDSVLYTPALPIEVEITQGSEQRRAAALVRAVDVLMDDGFVAVSLDLPPAPGIRAPCLGRSLELARGPFVLARLSGAAVVPVVTRWRRRGIEVTADAPLPSSVAAGPDELRAREAPTREAELGVDAAGWLERYLLAAPGEIGLGLLRELLASPRSPC